MHNCKTTRERMTELLLDGSEPRLLSRELRECAECREEFASLSETLRVTTRLIETATPPETFWPGYHERLKGKLLSARQPRVEPGQNYSFLTASIRVPVPVALALVLIVVFAFIFTIRVPADPTIVRVPVEVPVVREKTVTQVVYRDRQIKPRPKPARISPKTDSTLASLEGFKPAEEVKFTVIKGGAANEK